MPTEVCQPIISRAPISLDTPDNPSTRPSCQSTSACPSGSSEPQDHPRCLRNTSTGVDGRADGSTPSSLSPCSAPLANRTGALGPVLTRGSVRRAPKSIVLLRPERVGYQGGLRADAGAEEQVRGRAHVSAAGVVTGGRSVSPARVVLPPQARPFWVLFH